MPSMLNRVDRQYGYLSESIDVLEDNPVIILNSGDYLPSISDINSEENVYISLEDSTSKEYFLVTNAIIVGGRKNLYTEREKFGSDRKSWSSSDNIKVYLCRLVSINGHNFQEFQYQNSSSQLVSKQMQDSIDEIDNRLDLFANTVLSDQESMQTSISNLENNKLDITLLNDTKEPSGLLIEESTIEFFTNPSTNGPIFRIFPKAINYMVYVDGTKYLKTTVSSLALPDTEGFWFFYFNGSGDLEYSSNYTDFLNNVPVALGYWDSVGKEWTFVSEERNGITMDWATKKYLLGIEGLRWKSGFDSIHQASEEDPVDDSDSTFSIDEGYLYSQDIFINVEDSTSSGYFIQNLNNIPFIYYGDSSFKILTSENSEGYPFYYDSDKVWYNKLDGGSYTLTEVEDEKYFCTWVLGTKDYTNPIYYHITSSTYDTLDIAKDEESTRDLAFLDVEYLQIKILYKLIFKYDSSWVSEDVPTGVKLVDVTDYRAIPNKLNIGSHAALNDLSFAESSHTGFQKETYHNDAVPDFNHDRIDSNGIGTNFRTGDFWMRSFFDTTGSSLYVCMNAAPNEAIWTPVLTEYSLSEILNGTDWTLGSVTLNNSLIFGNSGNKIYNKLDINDGTSTLYWYFLDDSTPLMSIDENSEFTVYNCAVNLKRNDTLFGLSIEDTTGEGGTIFSRNETDNSLLPLNVDSYSIVHDSEDEKNFIILKNNLNPDENTSLAEISFENNYTNMSLEFSQEDDRTSIKVNSNELHLAANSTSGIVDENYYGKIYYDGDSQKILFKDNLGSWVNLEYGYNSGNVLYVDEKRTDIYTENGSYDRPYTSLEKVIDSITEEISDLENPIEISSIEELQKIGNDENYPMDGNYILTGNINAIDTTGWNGGNGFESIGNSSSNRFSGGFDGRGYTISNLHIVSSTISSGLFGSTDTSTIIKNLIIKDSDVTASITSGILVGYARGKIENCAVIDSTSSSTSSGMIKGIIIGVSNNCEIDNCYVENCTLYTNQNYAVGFIGSSHNSSIKNCYSIGCTVTSKSISSGFIYYIGNNTIIENCFCANTLICTDIDVKYGFCGNKTPTSTLNDSFYDSDISGVLDTGKGEPKTTIELKTQSTFLNWDFSNTWEIDEGVSYPNLQDIILESEYNVLGYIKKVIVLLPGNYELTGNKVLPSTISLVGFEKYSSTIEGNYKLSTTDDDYNTTIKNIVFNNSEIELNNLVTLEKCSGTAKITVNNSVRINDCTFENEDVAIDYVEGDTLILDSSKINGYYNSVWCSGTSGKLYASETTFLNNDATSATIYITESTGSAQLFLNNCTINNNGGNLVVEQLTAYDDLNIHNIINNCYSDDGSIAKFYNNKTRVDNWISCEFPEDGNEDGTVMPKPASEIFFDNSTTSFVSTNVQDAIYEAAVINTFGGVDLKGTQSDTFQLNWNTGPMFKVYGDNLLGTASSDETTKIDFTSRSFYGCLIPNSIAVLDSSNSPSVQNGNVFRTPILSNPIQINSLPGGVNGQKITIIGNQGINLVSIEDSRGNGGDCINLVKTPFTPSDVKAITLMKTSHGWVEISRSVYDDVSYPTNSFSIVYVDSQRLTDITTEDGSREYPFENISGAIDHINSESLFSTLDEIILFVLPGEYDEGTITIPENVNLVGMGNPLIKDTAITLNTNKTSFQNIDFDNTTMSSGASDNPVEFINCDIADSITLNERFLINKDTSGGLVSSKGVFNNTDVKKPGVVFVNSHIPSDWDIEENGSFGRPFTTLEAALDYLETNSDDNTSLYLISGDYEIESDRTIDYDISIESYGGPSYITGNYDLIFEDGNTIFINKANFQNNSIIFRGDTYIKDCDDIQCSITFRKLKTRNIENCNFNISNDSTGESSIEFFLDAKYPTLRQYPSDSTGEFIHITDTTGLYNIRNDLNANYILDNDIVFQDSDFEPGGFFYNSGEKWVFISLFDGILDGNNYSIINLQTDSSVSSGLFFASFSGTIKNLTIRDSVFRGVTACSPFGFNNGGTIENCYCINNEIESLNNEAAGFVRANEGYITGCYSSGNVKGKTNVGGFCRLNSSGGIINNCYSTCYVESEDGFAAGFIYSNNASTVVNCYSSGRVVGDELTSAGFCFAALGGYTLTSSYYDKDVAQQTDTGFGEAKTTEEMLQESTFIGWDFSTIWDDMGVDDLSDVDDVINKFSNCFFNCTNDFALLEINGPLIVNLMNCELRTSLEDNGENRGVITSDRGILKLSNCTILNNYDGDKESAIYCVNAIGEHFSEFHEVYCNSDIYLNDSYTEVGIVTGTEDITGTNILWAVRPHVHAREVECRFIDSTGFLQDMDVQEALDVIREGDIFYKYDQAYKIFYDNSESALSSNDIQEAIDEIDNTLDTLIGDSTSTLDDIDLHLESIDDQLDTLDNKIDTEITNLENSINSVMDSEVNEINYRINTISNWNEWIDANDFSGPTVNGADPTEIVLSGTLYTSWVLIYPKEVITRSVTKTVLTEYWDGTNAIYADVYWIPATSTNPSDTVKLKLYSECIPVGSVLGNDMTEVSTETSTVGETNQLNKTTFGPFIPNGANALDKELVFFMLERLDDDTYGSNIYVTGIRLRPEPLI